VIPKEGYERITKAQRGEAKVKSVWIEERIASVISLSNKYQVQTNEPITIIIK